MAKYAFGFIAVMLVAALAALSMLQMGQSDFFFGAGRGVGGGVGVAEPMPLPGVEPAPAPVDERPPDLIVTDAEHPTPLSPVSFCWSVGDVGTCADGSAPMPGEEPTFVAIEDTPLHLDFQIEWDVSIQVEPQDALCPAYSLSWGTTSNGFLDTLGPAGEYVLWITAFNKQGDASWVIRVDNQSDLPLPDGVTC